MKNGWIDSSTFVQTNSKSNKNVNDNFLNDISEILTGKGI